MKWSCNNINNVSITKKKVKQSFNVTEGSLFFADGVTLANQNQEDFLCEQIKKTGSMTFLHVCFL